MRGSRLSRRGARALAPARRCRRRDEAGEQRMRARRPRLELGMELTPDEPGMRRQLDDLHELSVRRQPAEPHTVVYEKVAILIRHLVAVTMALADLADAVHLRDARSAREATRIRTEPHGAAHVRHVLLRFHQRDDGVVALGRKLG